MVTRHSFCSRIVAKVFCSTNLRVCGRPCMQQAEEGLADGVRDEEKEDLCLINNAKHFIDLLKHFD